MGLGPSSNPQADAPSPALDISSDALPIDRRVVPSTPTSAMLSVSPSDYENDSELATNSHLVPTVITWSGAGNKVYVTGTFNGWKEKIPLHRSERDFTTIQYLPPGVHQYKFIVDGRWRHATDQPVAADVSGNLNNCVEIRAMSQTSLASSLGTDGGTTTFTPRSPPGDYDQDEELDDTIFIKEPPSLPPHLMRALLNTAPVSKDDPVLLPLPHHVMIDHCYFLSRPGVPDEQTMKDVRVVGMTHRYRAKFVTTVFYVPVEEPSPSQD